VLGALFRWLIAQRYVLANPFAGIKVRGHTRTIAMDPSRGFADGEWRLIRPLADGLEHSYGWEVPAAQRLRFLLDFAYATGLRASELVGATLGGIQTDAHGDQWLHLIGKGSKPGKVALPPLARNALDRYLIHRRLPVTPARWNPQTPLIGSLEQDSAAGITGSRLWSIMKRFFAQAADVIQGDNLAMALSISIEPSTPVAFARRLDSHRGQRIKQPTRSGIGLRAEIEVVGANRKPWQPVGFAEYAEIRAYHLDCAGRDA
jgi:hypothetical protein